MLLATMGVLPSRLVEECTIPIICLKLRQIFRRRIDLKYKEKIVNNIYLIVLDEKSKELSDILFIYAHLT